MVASNVLVTAALTGAAVASAIPASNKIGNFKSGRASVQQVPRQNYKPNGPLSVYKTYLKYKTPVPDWLAQAVANSTGVDYEKVRRDSGSAVTTPIDTYDDAYTTPVSIGTPAQVLNLDFDTGSSDLWVFSSLTAAADIDGQNSYDPTDSSTAELVKGATWDISYGDGSSSSGVVYTDVVSIGGVSVESQAVEAAETVSDSFTSDSSIDGLVGLGFDRLNTVSPTSQSTFWQVVTSPPYLKMVFVLTFVFSLCRSNALDSLDEPVFAANLNHQARKFSLNSANVYENRVDPSDHESLAGTYDFGFINDTFADDLTYTAVTQLPGYWKFTSTGYGVGDDL